MDNRPAILGLANPPLSPTSLVLGLDTLASIEMTASKPRPIPPICLAFVRIVTWILLPGIGLAYTYQALTTTLGEWLSFLVSGFLLFLGGTWVAAPFLASSSSGQLLVTTAALCACGLLILLKLLFLFVVLIVGSLLLAGQAVSERGILGLLGDIFWGCLSVVLTVRRFVSNGSSPLPLSRRQPARREVVRENPNLRKLLVRPDISPPLAPKGTGCSAKLDVLRAMDNEVNNEAHRRMEEIRHLEEKFKAADAESVERIAAAKRFLDRRMADFEARKAQGFIETPEPGETTTAIVAQAATLRDRLGLDDYEDINASEPFYGPATVTRVRIEQSYLVTAILRLKKTVEERDNTIREQAKKFNAFKDGVHDMSKRWEKTFDSLEEKLKTREAEIDGLKREVSMKDEKRELKAKPKRRGTISSRADACVSREVHQSFEQSDLFQEAAQRQFRRDHRATLSRPLFTPSPSGSSSSANMSAAEETIKPVRAGKRRILRPAPN